MATQRFALVRPAAATARPLTPRALAVTKIKKQLIHKAKVKKAYAKIKARDQPDPSPPSAAPPPASREQPMHPTRELMLADEQRAQAGAEGSPAHAAPSEGRRRRTRRPGYYDKQLAEAEERRRRAEDAAREAQRRREERARKLAERDRVKRAMAKTRGPDGRKKLGRESSLLLDKVKKLVAEDK